MSPAQDGSTHGHLLSLAESLPDDFSNPSLIPEIRECGLYHSTTNLIRPHFGNINPSLGSKLLRLLREHLTEELQAFLLPWIGFVVGSQFESSASIVSVSVLLKVVIVTV